MTNIFGITPRTRQTAEDHNETEKLVTLYDLASAMTFEQLVTGILRHLPNRGNLETGALHDFGNRISRLADEMERGQ